MPGAPDDVAGANAEDVSAILGVTIAARQVQDVLANAPGTQAPTLRLAGASVARPLPIPSQASMPASRGVEVGVPAHTHCGHVGHYPAWESGDASCLRRHPS